MEIVEERESEQGIWVDKCLQFIWPLLKCLTNLFLGGAGVDFVELRLQLQLLLSHATLPRCCPHSSRVFRCLAGIMLIRILHFNKFLESHTALLSPELLRNGRQKKIKEKMMKTKAELLPLSVSLSLALCVCLSLSKLAL